MLRASGSPAFDRDGRRNGYRGVGRDITVEWEAGQRLRKSEQRFRSLVENLHGIICHGIAGDGPHGYEQGAQIHGADAAALAGTVDDRQRARIDTWYDAIHEADRPAYAEAMMKTASVFRDPARRSNSSSAEQVAADVWAAVNDPSEQVTHVSGTDAKTYYALRLKDGIEAFRKVVRQTFLGV